MKSLLQFAVFVWAGAIFCSCASTPHPLPIYQPEDNKYTSAYPTREISGKLSQIQHSVQRILSTAVYNVHYFNNKRVTAAKVTSNSLKNLSDRNIIITQRNAGTAISILRNDDYTLFITAFHVIASPDTVFTYKRKGAASGQRVVKSVAVKSSSKTSLIEAGVLIDLKVLATDPFNDLALLVANNDNHDFSAPPLSIRTGTAKNLQLGSVIYVLGYPLGNPMVTSGIVSAPDFDTRAGFLTDALFNHGISGGLIIASNDGYNSFEWIGMTTTASVTRKHFLVPEPKVQSLYSDFDVYDDPVYIDQMSFINYGVSRATPIEDILGFIFENEKKLNKYGLSATELAGQ